MDVLRDELAKPGVRSWLGNARVHVSKLDAVYGWKDHLEKQGVSVAGGLLLDATANHSFTFVRRKGSRAQGSISFFMSGVK